MFQKKSDDSFYSITNILLKKIITGTIFRKKF